MDDLASKLQEILNTQEGQDNLKRVTEMLGANNGNGPDLSSLAGLLNNNSAPKEEEPTKSGDSFDISALTKLLGNSQNSPPNTNEGKSSAPDLSSIISSLTNNNGGASSSGPDLSALAGLLGGGQNAAPPAEEAAPSPAFDLGGLDINMLMKMQQMMSSVPKNDKNTDLIRALKPHLKEERQDRVDEAIRMMQLMNMLPMLKESGLFGNGLLGGLFGGG